MEKKESSSPSRSQTPKKDDEPEASDSKVPAKSKVQVVMIKAVKPKDEGRSKAESKPKEKSIVDVVQAEQKKIEEEMKKRRERLEAWRAARQKEEEEIKEQMEEEKKRKGWTLEDDDEDDEEEEAMEEEAVEEEEAAEKNEVSEPKEDKMEEQSEIIEEYVDPLDAFMVGVQQEVKKINEDSHRKAGRKLIDGKSEVTTMITATKSKQGATPLQEQSNGKKGELMQNDQDAVEYSDEENKDEELASALLSISKKGKKKDLPRVDHKAVEYMPFTKNFYVEVPELARMTPEEVSTYRIDLEGIKTKGKDCPKPVKSWVQCGLSSKIMKVIKKCNYEKPTPIQAQAIPAIMSGRDLIGIAKTGSGKTLAFLLPMLRHIMHQPALDYADGPIGVILTPTRELAIQIYNECKKFCKPLGLHPICVYGGTGISEQIADLKKGGEIVICTPGRMIDMLAANSGRVTNLRRATYLVLDEADRMFDMGFEPQVTKIVSNVRPDRQTVMFSATFPRPMEALARKILNKPIEVQVGGRSVVCKDVDQSIVILEDHQKFHKLLELLGLYQEKGGVLVFVEKQEFADYLIRDLMRNGYPCMALHGGMDQSDRDSTLSDFKNGNIKLLVATSVAARGLDVKDLILVVNYSCPNHYEDYVHRCGRTGRAGNKGSAYTFITAEQYRYAGEIIKALELSGATVPPDLETMWNNYIEKLKTEGKYKPGKKMSGGFKGKGFKFDAAEQIKAKEAKLKQKSALGLADSDDEDEVALINMEKKLEEVFSGKARLVDPTAPRLPPPSNKPPLLPTPGAVQGLAAATAIADRIMMNKQLGPSAALAAATQEAASSILKGGEVNITGAALASQIASTINDRIGAGPAKASKTFLPVGVSVIGENGEEENPSAVQSLLRYEETIDINDFPQQIRFRITTREVLDDVGEFSEAYVTVRGNYIPNNRQARDGEQRLHLAIESKTERAVVLAKQEIKQIITAEAQRMASRVGPQHKSGRYSVL